MFVMFDNSLTGSVPSEVCQLNAVLSGSFNHNPSLTAC